MLPKLKQFVSSYKGDMALKNWIVDGRGYPVPQGLTTDIPGANQLRVAVIGDRLEPAMETGVKMIADHYDNCIAVDFRVAGYNNIPKYSGSHPTAAGHYTMASTIYKQFMKWVEF